MKPLMLDAARTRFRASNVVLPSLAAPATPGLVRPPLGGGSAPKPTISGVARATGPTASKATASPLPVPPALVRAASSDARDVAEQKRVNDEIEAYLDGILEAIVGAHDLWRRTAMLVGLVVNGPIAMGGRLEGMSLEAPIRGFGPQVGLSGNAGAATASIAAGIGALWSEWQASVTVPGLPWYPTFAAWPGPIAAPTPNMPAPLAVLASSGSITKEMPIMAAIAARRQGAPFAMSAELFAAVAAAVAAGTAMWLRTQQVMMVLGTGPVPTFAPPHVGAGPVVGGTNVPTPNLLA